MIKSNHHVPINSLLDEHLIPILTPLVDTLPWLSIPMIQSQVDLPTSTFADLIASWCCAQEASLMTMWCLPKELLIWRLNWRSCSLVDTASLHTEAFLLTKTFFLISSNRSWTICSFETYTLAFWKIWLTGLCKSWHVFFFLRRQNIMLVNLTTNPFKALVLASLQVPRDNTSSSQILNAGSSFPCKCETTLFILKKMPLTFCCWVIPWNKNVLWNSSRSSHFCQISAAAWCRGAGSPDPWQLCGSAFSVNLSQLTSQLLVTEILTQLSSEKYFPFVQKLLSPFSGCHSTAIPSLQWASAFHGEWLPLATFKASNIRCSPSPISSSATSAFLLLS